MKLSILICSLPDRSHMLNRLGTRLRTQIDSLGAEVEILIDDRPRGISVGQKRNDLLKQATGNYFCFIDDDDNVDNDYLKLILEGIDKGVDVVTFCGWMTTNGSSRVDWVIKLGERYEARKDNDGITRYYRFPNHLCSFKKSKVHLFYFPSINQGEDFQWALKIHESGCLKTEHHITKQIYHYDFKTNK